MAKSLLGLLSLLPGALVLAAACGGTAFENNAMAGAGGSGASSSGGTGSGGKASGGTTGIAGSTSVAGSSSKAGSGNSGGSSGAVGSGGSGAAVGNGGSGAAVGSGGSGGVDIAACNEARVTIDGTPVPPASSNSQCEVVPASCCSCGAGPITSYTAINSSYATQYNARCGGVACSPCPLIPQSPNDPALYYAATCKAGRCQVVDLGATPVTACTTASDCTLRSGVGCCSGCAGRPVAININEEPALDQTVCGSEPVACPACAPSFSGYSAGCTSGRCSVVVTPCTSAHPCPL